MKGSRVTGHDVGVRAVRGLTINQKCDDAFCLTRGNLRSNGEHELRGK